MEGVAGDVVVLTSLCCSWHLHRQHMVRPMQQQGGS